MSDKSICANCEHCYIRAIYIHGDPVLKYHFCTLQSRLIAERIDPISGEIIKVEYPRCEKFNKHGECTEFSEGKPEMNPSPTEEFWNSFRKLFPISRH